jgi:spore coat polysaccharide biosynthesis protein SpsF
LQLLWFSKKEDWPLGSPTIRVVVQARMRSSRLPGKVLADLAGHPLLEYVLTRLLAAGNAHQQLMVATSTAAADEAIEDFCRSFGVPCYRGSEHDVLGRFVAATDDLADDDLVVRATADNPLYCPIRSAAIITEHRRRAADYTCIENLSYVVPEVMTAGALRAMAAVASDARSREHVTPYFREAKHAFRVHQLSSKWQGLRPEIRLTVDTPDELELMAQICRGLRSTDLLFPLEDVYEYFSKHARRAV